MITNQPNIEYVIELRRDSRRIDYVGRSDYRRCAPVADPSDIFTDKNRNRSMTGFKKLSSAVAALPKYSYFVGAKIVSFDLNATPCVPVEVVL